MQTAPPDPRKNHLLRAMPEMEWERFATHLTHVALGLGDVIYESGTEQPYVYFPADSIVSLLYVMENGSSAEHTSFANPDGTDGRLQSASHRRSTTLSLVIDEP